jgi:hypothetical protein
LGLTSNQWNWSLALVIGVGHWRWSLALTIHIDHWHHWSMLLLINATTIGIVDH